MTRFRSSHTSLAVRAPISKPVWLFNVQIWTLFRFLFRSLARARVVVLAGIIFLSACHAAPPIPKDVLVVGLESAPTTLDPRLAADAYSAKISKLLHNGLFRVNEHLEVVPDLAESFKFVDERHLIIRIKSGIHFHHGKELTAEDVKYTYESILDPTLASPFRGTFSKIESIHVTSELTLEIILKEPNAPFLSALTMGLISSDGKNPQIGTGPFELDQWVNGEFIRLKRFESYSQKPRMRVVEFRFYPDDNLRILALKNHRLDILQNNVPPLLVAALQRDPQLGVQSTDGINVTYLGFNLRKGPLSKTEVREAIAHAIDRKALISYRMVDMAHMADTLMSPLHWSFEPELTQYEFDPQKARALLDKAGYPDPDGRGPRPRFKLTYKTSTKKDRIALARLMAKYLGDIGIEVEVLPYEWATFFHDISQGNFELFSLTWVGLTEPDIYYSLFHSSQLPPEGLNRAGYNNVVIDRLVEEGRKQVDMGKRKEAYGYVQKLLAQELPLLPLWYEDNVAVYQREVKGLRLRPDASFEWVTEVWKE